MIIFWILFAVKALAFVGGVAGLIHAIATRPDAFPAIDTKPKGFWVAVLAVSTIAVVLCGLMSPTSIFFLAGVIGISVYLADVRPRADEIQGKSWFRKAA